MPSKKTRRVAEEGNEELRMHEDWTNRLLGLVFHLSPLMPLAYIIGLPLVQLGIGDGQIWLFILLGIYGVITAWLGYSVPNVLFVAGVVISEFPGHFLIGQLLLIILQVVYHLEDTLFTLVGLFGLAINFIPVAAFSFFVVNQYLARYHLRRGLSLLAIEDDDPRILGGRKTHTPLFHMLTLRNWWKPIFPVCSVFLPKILGGLHREVGVVFASVSSELSSTDEEDADVIELECDIYSDDRYRNDKRLPVVIYIHGGAWTVGRKDLGISFPVMHEIVANGWLCVSINYRLCPHNVDMLTQIIDCKRAIKWVRENIEQYGGNPDYIACMGESAGGHLAVVLALTQNIRLYQPGFEEADTSVLGCIDLFGVHDLLDTQKIWGAPQSCTGEIQSDHHSSFVKWLEEKVIKKSFKNERELWETLSPYQILQSLPEGHEVPPIFGIHGEKDSVVPVEDSDLFYDTLFRYRMECERRHEEQEMEEEKEAVEKEGDSVSTSMVKRPRLWRRVGDAYVKFPGAHHGFTSWSSVRSLAVGDASVAFLSCLAEAHTKH